MKALRSWNFLERLRFSTGRKNDVPQLLEINLKGLQCVSVIFDDEYAQRIKISAVSSHTVWESRPEMLPAVTNLQGQSRPSPPNSRAIPLAALSERIKNCHRASGSISMADSDQNQACVVQRPT